MIRSIPVGSADISVSVAAALVQVAAAAVWAISPLCGLPVVTMGVLLLDQLAETFVAGLGGI